MIRHARPRRTAPRNRRASRYARAGVRPRPRLRHLTFIRNRSGDVLALEGPALYQALQRLEKDGLIDWEWGLSENNRKAKFYRLTPKGTARLKAQRKMWARFAEAMAGVLAPS